jgi:hypothetical protein
MKAARYYGPGNVKLDQVPEPQAQEGQLKIKVYPSALDILYFCHRHRFQIAWYLFNVSPNLTDIHVVVFSTFRNGSRWLSLIFKHP